ncbi:hypothetical protein ACH5RR_031669 [Cinchona calisaya]|uniref:Ribosomal protein L2 n=1 Tax=Cinchona calisaya TaxID=153742 RepID=A0ABD2YIX9_9GENT
MKGSEGPPAATVAERTEEKEEKVFIRIRGRNVLQVVDPRQSLQNSVGHIYPQPAYTGIRNVIQSVYTEGRVRALYRGDIGSSKEISTATKQYRGCCSPTTIHGNHGRPEDLLGTVHHNEKGIYMFAELSNIGKTRNKNKIRSAGRGKWHGNAIEVVKKIGETIGKGRRTGYSFHLMDVTLGLIESSIRK